MNKRKEEEKPHLVEPEYGAPYWRQFMWCSDGRVVSGVGPSAMDAQIDANNERAKREEYLALGERDRLRILCKGDLLDTDKKEAIRLIAKILLND